MNIVKPISEYLVHGQAVDHARIKAVDEDQGIVICDLEDANGQVLAVNRYFFLDDLPFNHFTDEERAVLGLTPGPPDNSWNKKDIKVWMDAQDPPIPFKSRDTKAELLKKIVLAINSEELPQ